MTRGRLWPWSALLLVALALLVGGLFWLGRGSPSEALPGAGEYRAGELLVALRAPGDPTAIAADHGLRVTVQDFSEPTGIYRLRITSGEDPADAAEQLSADPRVRFAEPNYALRVAQEVPTDPRYADQAPFWEIVGAPDAWAMTQGSRAVVVALLDGAVDLDHPDLAANIWTNPGEIPGNGVDDDGNGYVDDVHGYDFVGQFRGQPDPLGEDGDPDVKPDDAAAGDGLDQDGDGVADGAVGHGTSVAGLIGAVANNGIGVAGTAWRVSLMPVRVTGPEGDGFFSSFVKAMDYAVINGADVINISLAAPSLPSSAATAVQAALDAGALVIAAAGNSGFNVSFPGALDGVIAVGSSGVASPDTRASFSPRNAGVEIVAPGSGLITTYVRPRTAQPDYTSVTGTSFSAPLVSGTAALILALRPAASAADVRTLILENADNLSREGEEDWDGAGRLNMGRAIAAAAETAPTPPTLENVSTTQGRLHVAGRSVPGSTVGLSDPSSGLDFGSTTAGGDGSYAFDVPLTSLPEQLAVLDLEAIASTPQGVSSTASVSVALPHDTVLLPGWNLVPWAGAAAGGATVLASLPSQVDRAYAWSEGTWHLGIPGVPEFSLTRVATGMGLWVWLNGERPVVWHQERAPFARVMLSTGWNLASWSGATVSPSMAVNATPAGVDAFYGWDAVRQRYLRFLRGEAAQINTLGDLRHLQAVWVLVGGGGGAWPGAASSPVTLTQAGASGG